MLDWLIAHPMAFAVATGWWAALLLDLQQLYTFKKFEDARAGFDLRVSLWLQFRGALGGFIGYVTASGISTGITAITG
jgi:hypothetical protein